MRKGAGRVGIVHDNADCHCSCGERLAPLHVYRPGIDLPSEKLELRTQNEVRVWPCAGPDRCQSRTDATAHDTRTMAMARIRLRQGMRSILLISGFIAPLSMVSRISGHSTLKLDGIATHSTDRPCATVAGSCPPRPLGKTP
jgi:hypothetical protein